MSLHSGLEVNRSIQLAASVGMREPVSAYEDTTPGAKVAQNPDAKAGMHHCGRCSSRWNGYNTCHCSACHQTFTGLTAFDKHRAGSHMPDTRHCLEPASRGLVDAGRAYACWGLPGAPTWSR